ncbi:ABC transporter ATP-binding protein [Rummeliibacillus suwonensis]|uniref:ABC transporter ATP-binding protein n=1 Tax=Rummeliibacillus suwonensis TaxID=1306154 RepID=UPI0011B5CDE6|nr:ABC transporter ATP-binding protein [Rummeliibacillus suwonensis]MBO2537612.1 ABC transporter ATP-binding protein [Rummeliibacillus suwonensis]
MVETIELSQKSEKEALQNKIEVKSVHFSYGETEILQDINLEVKEGEFLVLMGPSGSGKSTLLRMLANLSQPKSGQILFDSPLDLAVVFQDYSLFPWLTAEENIVLALKQKLKKTKTKKELQQLAEQYLTLVQLGHAIKKYPGEMSGGMRQRAAIARALSVGSDLVLMDEPFGALDPLTRIQLQDLILQINHDQKRTIVFVTHDVEEAIILADRIVMFSPGPPGKVVDVIEVPFEKPRNRKQLFNSQEFVEFRDYLLGVMNKGVFEKLNQSEEVSSGEGI